MVVLLDKNFFMLYNFVMKRTIIIVLIMILTLGVSLACTVVFMRYGIEYRNSIKYYSDYFPDLVDIWRENMRKAFTYGVFSLLSSVGIFIAMVILAVRDFPVFRPLIDKLHSKLQAKRAAHKEKRAKQAEIAKQERISKLQAELDELKKDE